MLFADLYFQGGQSYVTPWRASRICIYNTPHMPFFKKNFLYLTQCYDTMIPTQKWGVGFCKTFPAIVLRLGGMWYRIAICVIPCW